MKKKLELIMVAIILFNISGCFNYKEINKITFVTTVIFDIDEDEKVTLYLDCVTPYRNANESSDKGRRITYKIDGETGLEAIRKVNVESTNDLNYSQVKAYIFTQNALKKGIKSFLDLIENNQELGYKTYMFGYFGDINKLIKTSSNDEEYLGLFLDQLIHMNEKNSFVVNSNVNDYISDSINESQIGIISSIKIQEDLIDEKIKLDGGIVLKENKIAGRLDEQEIFSYNLLSNTIREGSLQIRSSVFKNQYVTLDILDNIVQTKIIFEDEDIIIKKKIDITASLGEMESEFNINNDMIKQLEYEEEQVIEKRLKLFFNKKKNENLDILQVARLVAEKGKKVDLNNILDKVKLDTEINVFIEGKGLVKNSV